MKTAYLNAKSARDIALEKVLKRMGYQPQKTTKNEMWYLSPFREEKTPSFKLNIDINKWFDFGEQIGGNTLDFVIHKFGFSVKEALNYLSKYSSFSFQPQDIIEEEDKPKFQNATVIQHPALIEYLDSRMIPEFVYKEFCKEIYYWNKGKRYFAIGFKNNSGGYELRTKNFKACLGTKDITYMKNGFKKLSVFEGFFDFLCYPIINHAGHMIDSDIIVLNSVANVNRLISQIDFNAYANIHLYLDNDEAGDKYTKILEKASHKVHDCRWHYKGFKDVNEHLVQSLSQ